MPADYYLLFITLTFVAIGSVVTKKLTNAAAIAGWLTGFFVYTGAGFTGIAMMAAFFIMATAATSHKLAVKQSLKLAERDKGKRTAGQVLANAGAAALLGIAAALHPQHGIVLRLMLAASLASAAADTISSELGNVYGKRYYNITTFKKDDRGLNGVVSLEGTFTGLAASAVIACIYSIGFSWNISALMIIVVAGTIGNLADSLLGAIPERRGYLNNNAVNFLNTVIAAMAAWVMYKMI